MNDDEFILAKAEIFRILRVNQELRAKVVLEKIKEHLPDVDDNTIKRALIELHETIASCYAAI